MRLPRIMGGTKPREIGASEAASGKPTSNVTTTTSAALNPSEPPKLETASRSGETAATNDTEPETEPTEPSPTEPTLPSNTEASDGDSDPKETTSSEAILATPRLPSTETVNEITPVTSEATILAVNGITRNIEANGARLKTKPPTNTEAIPALAVSNTKYPRPESTAVMNVINAPQRGTHQVSPATIPRVGVMPQTGQIKNVKTTARIEPTMIEINASESNPNDPAASHNDDNEPAASNSDPRIPVNRVNTREATVSEPRTAILGANGNRLNPTSVPNAPNKNATSSDIPASGNPTSSDAAAIGTAIVSPTEVLAKCDPVLAKLSIADGANRELNTSDKELVEPTVTSEPSEPTSDPVVILIAPCTEPTASVATAAATANVVVLPTAREVKLATDPITASEAPRATRELRMNV